MENALLNNHTWPYPKTGVFQKPMMDGQQHYDLLISVLGSQCGIHMKDFKLHTGIAIDNLISMPEKIRSSVQMIHSQFVSLIHPAGEILETSRELKFQMLMAYISLCS